MRLGRRWATEPRIKVRSKLKVEDQLKPRSLFTVPLSLYRKLDRVAVCVNPAS
ncbi:MAG: hypothetical protein NZ992_06170 [Candidatus Korarchaeum sp.]|nr:hypothetical protein [Candidatus Korarchaeum sp.]MDW8035629.1 hypothetical protein [Candidatus Korarchaeum sp.]